MNIIAVITQTVIIHVKNLIYGAIAHYKITRLLTNLKWLKCII